MHLVESVLTQAGCCAITGAASDPDGFVATEYELDPAKAWGRAHLSVLFLREAGEIAGMVRPEVHDAKCAELDVANARIEELERELAGAKAEADAMIVCAGPKLWGRAQSIRKAENLRGKRRFDRYLKIYNGGENFSDAELRALEALGEDGDE